jgi:hypothetical protein
MYKYLGESLKAKLIDIIEHDKKHQFYQQTVDYAKYCKQIMTGDDQDELVISYKISETATQKEQRLRLYNSRTGYVSNKILSTFNEVERTDAVVDNISYNSEVDIDGLKSRLEVYTPDQNFKKYVHDAARRLNFYDPNAWIVTEFRVDEPLKAPYPYPMEVFSDQAIDFEVAHNKLQYLVVCHKISIKKNDTTSVEQPTKTAAKLKTVDGKKFTIYGAGNSYRITELGDEPTELDTIVIKEIKYTIEFFDTKVREVPAVRIGYIKNASTGWKTFVSPLHPAKHIMQDLINNKSEYDLHKALHGFIQKYVFAEACDFIAPDNQDRCNGGNMNISGKQCTKCKGTGKKIHTTVQDVILIKMPEFKDEHIPLKDFVHYVEIPKHIIDAYKQDVKDLELDVSYAIFNKDTFTKSDVANTAFEVKLNKQSVYNVLSDFGDNVSRLVKTLTRQAADAIGLPEGIMVEYMIPKDFRMDSLEDILTMRKAAIDAGSPYDVVSNFDIQMLQKQNIDNPTIVDQIKAQEGWRPFKDKTLEERIMIISMLEPLDPDKVLYTYFDKIFTKIWSNPAFNLFHKMKYDAQKIIVDREVEAIIKDKTPVVVAPTVLSPNAVDVTDPNPVIGDTDNSDNASEI